MKKRITCLIITAAMLLSFAPVSWAEEESVSSESANISISESSTDIPEETGAVVYDDAVDIQEETSASSEGDIEMYTDDTGAEESADINDADVQLFASFSPRTSAPSLYDYWYQTGVGVNPLSNGGGRGNCTWYAWGRASEILGHALPSGAFIHNAATWWDDNIRLNAFTYGQTPAPGSIAVWGPCETNTAGHVAIVEAVNGDYVTISESSWGGVWYSHSYWGTKTYSLYDLKNSITYDKKVLPFLGFIYLTGSGGSGTSQHTHSWSSYYESAHPHAVYRSCSCGAKEYTGETRLLSDCKSCYPLGNVRFTRSFERTEKSVTFYRNSVLNATDYSMSLYRNGGFYNQYNMNRTSYRIDGLPSGTYYASLSVRNANTGQMKSVSCLSFTLVDTYTVTYNANGGANAPSSQSKIQNEDMTITSSIPNKTGHIFKGWASSKTATEAQYQPGGVYTKNTPITLYAVWEPETYTINFDMNGGKGEIESTIITYGDSMRMPNTVIREGYYLRGWSKTKNATEPDYRIGMDYMLTENTTLYAVWASSTWGGSVASGFAGGNGTAEDPYQISNASELAYLADRVNQQTELPKYEYYILTDNINLGYEEWVPIGLYDSGTQYFCGSFDGNGFTVSDLYMSGNNAGYVGLFGCAKNSDIKNLNVSGDVEGQSFSGTSYVGAVAGCAYGTDISGCNAMYVNISDISNSSSSEYTYIGIICGYADESGITDCDADDSYISVSQGSAYAGMMVGYIKGDITDCLVSSDVELFGSGSATRYLYMGGVCGYIDGNIEKCSVDAGYFSTTLSFVGGDIGGIAGNIDGSVELCSVIFDDGLERTIDGASYISSFYAEGSWGSNNMGGIVGNVQNGRISNCKYDGQSIASVMRNCANIGGIAGFANTGAVISVNGGLSLSRAELPTRRGYKTVWYTDTELTDEYDFSKPVTSDMTLYAKWSEGEDEIEIWDGTSSEPAYNAETKTYTVTNGRELAWISDVSNNVIISGTNLPDNINFEGYTVELADDIYLNYIGDVDIWETKAPANSWKPICNKLEEFCGTLDGKGYGIYGVYCVDDSMENIGLVGSLGGQIKNLTLYNGYVCGQHYVGGFAGRSYNGIFEHCTNFLKIKSLSDWAGGIVARADDDSQMSYCSNYGRIEAVSGAAGIVGWSNDGEILYCLNNAFVKGEGFVGGIVGLASGSDVEYCYNIYSIQGVTSAGGIAGSISGSNIFKCHNQARVSSDRLTGGVVGDVNYSSVRYCYSSGDVDGDDSDSSGGVIGGITASGNGKTYINYCYSPYTPLYNVSGEISSQYMTFVSVHDKSSTEMKTLYNLHGFSSSDWAVDAEINDGYPYLRSLEDTYRTCDVTIVEDPENPDMLSKCFANVDGILYGESTLTSSAPVPVLEANVGGIIGYADGDGNSNGSNLIAIADRVSSVGAWAPCDTYSGDIIGRMDNDAMDFRSVYSYSSMTKSSVNTDSESVAHVVETGTPRTITNIQRSSFLTTVFGPAIYQSLDYLNSHPDAVWVVRDGEFPELYYNVLNDITVSESENGTVSVDRQQAVDGEIVTVTAVPNENYVLNKVYVNGNEIDGTTFEVSGDSNVFATFAQETPEYDIKVTSSENADATLLNVDAQQEGEVVLMSGADSLTAKDGAEIRVDTEAAENYTVDAVYVNGEQIAGDSFIVTADSDVTMEVTSTSTEIKAVTGDASNIGNYFATLSGSVDGDAETTEKYIRYWAADSADIVYTTEVETGSGDYSIEVTNLIPETEYQYQMSETGEVKSFVTKSYYMDGSDDTPEEPTVTPPEPAEICFEIENMRIDNDIVCADIINIADSERSGEIILAAYDEEGALISIEVAEIELMPAGDRISCEFSTVEYAVGYKLFIWDSLNNMAPSAQSRGI